MVESNFIFIWNAKSTQLYSDSKTDINVKVIVVILALNFAALR